MATEHEFSKEQLEELIEEAIVDAYDEYEQAAGFRVMVEDNLALPFKTLVLGNEVEVTAIDEDSRGGLLAVCQRGTERQRVSLLDLPLPRNLPKGAEWIFAYRLWASGQ